MTATAGSALRKKPQWVTAQEAAALVPDNVVLAADGFGMMGVADEVYAAIERRFLDSGYPRGLTLLHTSGQSDAVAGISRFAHPGLLSRVVGGHWGRTPKLSDLIVEERVEGVCLPQGQLAHLYHAIAGGRPGNLTGVGLGTFVDPRHGGGRINAKALEGVGADEYVELVEVRGEEALLFKSFPISVAVIRGTKCDQYGNLSQEEEAAGLDSLALAMAARASGGIVIAQVREKVGRGEASARNVSVPGVFIDYVVETSDEEAFHRQAIGFMRDPGLLGWVHADFENGTRSRNIPASRLSIGELAASLVPSGAVINAGTGLPGDALAPGLDRLGISDSVVSTMESGVVGGESVGGIDFGAGWRPEAIIQQAAQFSFYNGAGVDVSVMGVGQVNAAGQVNVSKFGERVTGIGGFMDIVHSARRIIFLVSSDHPERKFVPRVAQVSFDGPRALARGQEVFLVSDGVILKLGPDGWALQRSVLSDERTREWMDMFTRMVRDEA